MKIGIVILIVFSSLILVFWLFWQLVFLRKPERIIPQGEELVSPANGKIINVISFDQNSVLLEKGYFGKIPVFTNDVSTSGSIVVIMMTPLNVHVQRSPERAEVVSKQYFPGKFLNAVSKDEKMSATFQNEHNQILLKLENGLKIKVIQIAGFLARRIVDYTEIGEIKEKGAEIGFINLGSQVALILPAEFQILVKAGDVVIDGETKIAKLK